MKTHITTKKCGGWQISCSVSSCDPDDPDLTCTSVEDFSVEESAGDDAEAGEVDEDIEEENSLEAAN